MDGNGWERKAYAVGGAVVGEEFCAAFLELGEVGVPGCPLPGVDFVAKEDVFHGEVVKIVAAVIVD